MRERRKLKDIKPFLFPLCFVLRFKYSGMKLGTKELQLVEKPFDLIMSFQHAFSLKQP